MLDIIFNNRTLDFASHYNLGDIYTLMVNAVKNTTFSFASDEAAARKSNKTKIKDFISQIKTMS